MACSSFLAKLVLTQHLNDIESGELIKGKKMQNRTRKLPHERNWEHWHGWLNPWICIIDLVDPCQWQESTILCMCWVFHPLVPPLFGPLQKALFPRSILSPVSYVDPLENMSKLVFSHHWDIWWVRNLSFIFIQKLQNICMEWVCGQAGLTVRHTE